MIEEKVNLNLFIASDRVSQQNIHPCLKSCIVGYCYIVNIDEKGTKVFDVSYDAWGRQTVTLNTIGLHRGYTGHEMLGEFEIINMNERLYDPVLGRFFSPDNYVQMPDNSQNFNRYSCCLNNPLKYTDPSGDFWNLIIGAAIGGVFNWASHGFQLNAKGLGYFATGAVAGAVGAGLASGVNVAMAGGNFWTGAAGLAKGIASTGFLAGAASGASAGFAGGFIYGADNSWVDGHSFGKGLLAGLESGGIGALESGLTGGIFGGIDAMDNHANFWTGRGYFDTTGAMAYQGCKPKEFKIGDKIKAKYVGRFEGQSVFESKYLGSLSSDEYAAFTLPDIGIFAGEGVFSSSQINGLVMMQHEFGHVLQYRKVGIDFYYEVIAKESAMNCNGIWPYNDIPHEEYWTETWANYLSKQYFGERWFGMEIKIKGHLDFYYPSKNVSRSFLFKKSLLPF
ncbi:RHS repeat domain-containing protein [Hoylesella timonensis]